MQPPPPPRRRRRSTRAAGPPAEGTVSGDAASDVSSASHAAAAPGRPARPSTEVADEVAAAPYRVVDDTLDHDDRAAAPVVPPSPPAADGPRRPARAPGPGQDPGRFGRWTTGRRSRPAREDTGERSLRALVTSRTTQLPPTTALRAREVEVPTADELAAADAELVIVRRNYVPPTALTTGRRAGRGRGERPVEERGRRRATGSGRPGTD